MINKEIKKLISQDSNEEQKMLATFDNAIKFGKSEKTSGKSMNLPLKSITKAIALSVAVIFTSCNSPAEKVENAKEEVSEAKEDLNAAQEEYVTDIELYRSETEKRIAENEVMIADLNSKIRMSKSKMKADYEKQVAALEQKNKDLRVRMNEYKGDSKENWNNFKTEFGKDMDELGNSLKNFTIDN